jgi:hypothetical protein
MKPNEEDERASRGAMRIVCILAVTFIVTVALASCLLAVWR